MMHFLQQESIMRCKTPFNKAGWSTGFTGDLSLPIQNNSDDCGMYMLKYADWLADGLWPSFSAQHMSYFRGRVMAEIIHQDILD